MNKHLIDFDTDETDYLGLLSDDPAFVDAWEVEAVKNERWTFDEMEVFAKAYWLKYKTH